MSKIRTMVDLEISGESLANWWWALDSNEQAQFFERLEEIKAKEPEAFWKQLHYLRESIERLTVATPALPAH